jgi:hypothetical protein
MTDEHPDAGAEITSAESAELNENLVGVHWEFDDDWTADDWWDDTDWDALHPPSPEEVASVTVLTVYFKAFLEALAKRHADGLADLLHRLRVRFRKNEVQIGVDGDQSATVVITKDLPDEARLALLDLDVTANELRGKLLRWDSSASAWRPADGQ